MNIKKILFIGASIFLVFNAIIYFFLIKPEIDKSELLTKEIKNKFQHKQKLENLKKFIEKYEEELPIFRKNSLLYQRSLIKDLKSSSIKIYLNELGKMVGNDNIFPIESFAQESKTQEVIKPYNSMTFKIDSNFTYKSLMLFIEKLIQEDRIFIINYINLSPVQEVKRDANVFTVNTEIRTNVGVKEQEELIKVSMEIEFCYFPDNKETK